jgi:hypothetical protein
VHCSRIGETRLSMVPVARIVQKLRKPHSPTRMEGSVKRWELLANFWQIAFSEQAPGREKVRTDAYLLCESMAGLGGLEPQASPLSVSRSWVPAPSSHPGNLNLVHPGFLRRVGIWLCGSDRRRDSTIHRELRRSTIAMFGPRSFLGSGCSYWLSTRILLEDSC